MRMKNLLGSVLFVLTLAACSPAPPPAAPDTRAADEKAIRDSIDSSTSALAGRDLDKFVAFYADDASVFVPGIPMVNGVPAIKEAMKESFTDPNFTIAIQTTKVEVSKASDYAYAQGTFAQKATDPKTKKVVAENGKWVTVFKKQADGSWKAVADIFNSDGPATPAKP
jgi:uncharacterized protein (TIGR02246 family)